MNDAPCAEPQTASRFERLVKRAGEISAQAEDVSQYVHRVVEHIVGEDPPNERPSSSGLPPALLDELDYVLEFTSERLKEVAQDMDKLTQ